eukprot:m.217471 g.217471  ORF g.217471 m.217471 type:complete len:287 (-) comp15886_c1_seq4:102-962(-)
MGLQIFTVDAFTSEPFSGNPAAVVLVEGKVDDSTMQKIATEMNLSETAFLETLDKDSTFESSDHFSLRWFTPTREVPLCGHATLASAIALFQGRDNKSDALRFETLSGCLVASRKDSLVSMDLPHNAPISLEKNNKYEPLARLTVGQIEIHSMAYSSSTKKLLVRLADDTSRETLEGLAPDTTAMQAGHLDDEVRGVMVTISGKGKPGDYDFLSRYFAPWNGIPEDPVTGSAHTVLGPYWADCIGKKELNARQCSPRGGNLAISVLENIVQVTGDGCIVMQGTLNL